MKRHATKGQRKPATTKQRMPDELPSDQKQLLRGGENRKRVTLSPSQLHSKTFGH